MHDVCTIIPYVYLDLIQFLHTSIRIELIGTYVVSATLRAIAHGTHN